MDRGTTWHERAEKVINRVNAAFPSPAFENWELCEELILSAITAWLVSKFKGLILKLVRRNSNSVLRRMYSLSFGELDIGYF